MDGAALVRRRLPWNAEAPAADASEGVLVIHRAPSTTARHRRIRPALRTRAPVAAALAALALGLLPAGAAGAATTTGEGLELSRTVQPLGPGTELTRYRSLEPTGWHSAQSLTVDLSAGARVESLAPDDVADAAPLSDLVRDHDPGPGRATVAAVNADFFDINGTKAPLGPGITGGALRHSASDGAPLDVAAWGPGELGRILEVYAEGSLLLPDGVAEVASYNAARVPAGGIGVYTSGWGTADRALTVTGAGAVTEVLVRDETVVSVSGTAGRDRVPEGASVLLGRDAGARTLAALVPGDTVVLEYGARTGDGSPLPEEAVGGRGLLVIDGEPQDWEGRPNNAAAPRTAVGFSRDGGEMYLVTVEGRQPHAGGATLTELAVLLADLGAYTALNLDGGGSTTLLARAPGDSAPRLVNSPSDGVERPVPNGLAVTVPLGSGATAGFRVETVVDPARTPTADPVPGGHPERVFPGLTRRLTATGHDETYGPAPAARPAWRTDRPSVGGVDADGTFTARRPGTTTVTAGRGGAGGGIELTVLGDLARIDPTSRRIALTAAGAGARFGLVGQDATGHSAPVEPADVTLEYDRSLFTVTPDPAAGGFTVTAAGAADGTAGQVRATAGGLSTVLAVTVGGEESELADFEDAGEWTFSHARAAGGITPEPAGQDGGGALRLSYDFTLSTATRAAYATPPRAIEVPGAPQSFALWIEGDGHGGWPSLHLKDAAGTDQVLRGDHVTWEGWRQVEFPVPEGLALPVSVHRFYLAETRPDAAYTGSIALDGLTVRTAPEAGLPPEVPASGPLIGPAAEVAERDWRFAVVSDAQFVARDPDSALAAAARRTLREARAAEPDFVLINGDWVDEGSRADLEFARQMIEEELGDTVPWYYVPGNHEVMGGSIELFEEVIGPAQRTFDHRGTRFITLDTSSLTLRGGGFAQFQRLRADLADAAGNPSVGSVVVVGHVPPRDPTVRPASELTDRMEAALLERWLADFRRTSGKGVAFFGAHVGVFDSSWRDGVPYVIGGDAGKAPAAPPGEGGFTGWALVGVDGGAAGRPAGGGAGGPGDAGDWLSVQTRPHVDGLALTAPATLAAGTEAAVAATVVQGDGAGARAVPVGYPVSADWSGSRALHLGPPGEAGRRQVAAFDPATGLLTALRPGEVTLRVEVSGVREEITVRVTR
ncbi:3',5'-cyclic AMP phosphodiesterase CpdA [Streptomyces harbinensis]|uniref:3',5'-cyclic AMP phosphodiesterase CpdA n=1 Tax=Streptomyces harbinensis TaxID=1176198 RepID=A0A1I6RYY7_9ACTN|nr:3',5'-cyclic AMP phosphodiesterase CpdA [Streptomyces harbinensis]